MTATDVTTEPQQDSLNELTAEVRFEQKTTRFIVPNEKDAVQRHHVKGNFYEFSDLLRHRTLIPGHGVVLDIGANVGNHTLFYAAHSRAKVIYPLEPNPTARERLMRNVALNKAAAVHFDFVEYGAGRSRASASVDWRNPNNLGSARLSCTASEDGPIAVAALDDLFSDLPDIHFVKIDVEGMEFDVLDGAANLIEKHRPSIAIEIRKRSIAQFFSWASDNAYHIIDMSRTHANSFNYVCVPMR